MAVGDTLYYLMLLWILLGLIAMLRNERVYRVRADVLDRPDWDSIYWSLPDYNDMLYRPRYWKLWTLAQWLKWVRRTSTAAPGVNTPDGGQR